MVQSTDLGLLLSLASRGSSEFGGVAVFTRRAARRAENFSAKHTRPRRNGATNLNRDSRAGRGLRQRAGVGKFRHLEERYSTA